MSHVPPPATRIGIAIGMLYRQALPPNPRPLAYVVIGLREVARASGLTVEAIQAVARECPGAIERALPGFLELSEDQEFRDSVVVRRRQEARR